MRKGNASALRRGRYSCTGHIYHIIITCKNRYPFFNDPSLARYAVLCLKRLTPEAFTLAFVVMPDHIHWLMKLNDIKNLSETVRLLKVMVTQKAGTPIWQSGYYDHALRKEEAIEDVARYIVLNPVRAGLCENVRQYPWWDYVYL
ncbi:REP-associated tyrosine transposase [Neptuniibacter sp. QD72_48]|uniref:REP-associated tyrosine transposase n=1 Tax=unclassified Neptuniibacter TaxID=2630693 RepID=UPI0039F6B4E2